MIRITPGVLVGPCLQDFAVRRDIDPVEAQDGQPRRECAQPRAHRASAGQYSPDGFYPKPIVEIADDDSAGVFDEFGDGTRLCVALMDGKAEMGGNHGYLAQWGTDAGSDRSAGLPFLIRDVRDDGRGGERKLAEQDLAVVAVLGDDGAGLRTMFAHHMRKPCKRVVGAPARVDLL